MKLPSIGSLLLLSVSLLLSFLGAEAFVRWHNFGPRGLSYSQMATVRHIGESGLIQASSNQQILWELRPNIDTIYKFKPFRTNSQGLRDEEYPLEKAVRTFRVAVIGDSYTMGEGIAIEEAYHSVLENRLNADDSLREYEFINFGVAGYSLVQYLATIEQKVLKYKPDLILIGFCAANDSEVPNFEAFNRPYQLKPVRDGFYQSFFFDLIGDRYKDIYKKLRGRVAGYNADPGYVDREFKQLSQLLSQTKIPVVIAYIDNRLASTDFDMVRDTSLRYGFEFIDGTILFSRELSPKHIIYESDNHPNSAANKLIADALYPALASSIRSHALILK